MKRELVSHDINKNTILYMRHTILYMKHNACSATPYSTGYEYSWNIIFQHYVIVNAIILSTYTHAQIYQLNKNNPLTL